MIELKSILLLRTTSLLVDLITVECYPQNTKSLTHTALSYLPAHAHNMYLTWIFSYTAVSHAKYIHVSCRCMSEYFHLYKHGKRLTKEKFPNFKDKKQYMTCMKFKYQIVSKILPTLQIQSSTLHVVLQQVCLLNLRCPSQLSFPGFCL